MEKLLERSKILTYVRKALELSKTFSNVRKVFRTNEKFCDTYEKIFERRKRFSKGRKVEKEKFYVTAMRFRKKRTENVFK